MLLYYFNWRLKLARRLEPTWLVMTEIAWFLLFLLIGVSAGIIYGALTLN